MKGLRKSLAVIIACLLVISCIPAVSAEDNTYNGFKYSIKNGEVTITGYVGEDTEIVIPSEIEGLPVYNIGDNAFDGCSKLNNVVVPSSVKKIGQRAFCDCYALTSVTLNEGLETLGSEAFMECTRLESIEIPDSVTNLGGNIFEYCLSLKNVKFPEGITRLPGGIFTSCKSITEINLPDTITAIGMRAYEKSGLVNAYLPENIRSIEQGAFYDCKNLKSVVIDGYIGSIPDKAFEDCEALESVKVNHNISSIGKEAFSFCKSLTDVDIHLYNTITSIGEGCFRTCTSLKNFNLSSRLTKIEGGTFSNCTALENIEISSMVTSIGNSAFYNCKSLKTAIIPNSVTTIGSEVFKNCESLESVKLTNKLTTVESSLFSNCISLKNIEMPDSVTEIKSNAFEKCSALENPPLPKNLSAIRDYSFSGCTGFESVQLSEKVSAVGKGAFLSCPNIKKVYVLNKKASISSYAFGYTKDDNKSFVKEENPPTIYGYYQSTTETYANNNGLNFVEMNSNPPDVQTVITLDSNTMEIDKSRMKKISYTVTNPGGKTRFASTDTSIATVDEQGRVRGVSAGTAYIVMVNSNATVLITVIVKDSDIDISEEQQNSEFKYRYVEDEDGELTVKITGYVGEGGKVVIPSKILGYDVKGVAGTFKDYLNITELEFSEGIEFLEYNAISGCDNIRSIKYAESLTSSEGNNFENLKKVERIDYPNLEQMIRMCRWNGGPFIPKKHKYTLLIGGKEVSELVIPESVSVIPWKMFMNCINIKSVVLSDNTKEVEDSAFENCTALESVRFPKDQMYTIGSCAFKGCSKITELNIPDSIITLGGEAFSGTSITTFKTKGIRTLYDGAFMGCPKLEKVHLRVNGEFNDFYNGVFVNSPALKEIYFDADTVECGEDIFKNMTASPTVYGASGSSIETSAKKYGLAFVSLESLYTEPATVEPTTAAPTEPKLPQIPVRPDYIYDAETLTCTLTDKEGATKPIMDDYAYGEAYHATTLIFDFNEEYRITNWCTQWFPNIEKIIVKGNISEIGRDAFSSFIGQNLKEIVLSDKVTAITDAAFYGCKKITAIPEGVNLKVIGNSAFANCTGMTEINIPNTVTEIGKYAFGGNENITEVEIPETVTSIGEYAFGYLYNSKQNSNYPIPNFRIIAQKDSAGAKYAFENGFTLICDGEVITAPEPEETTTASIEPTTAAITTEPTETTTEPVETTTAEPETSEPTTVETTTAEQTTELVEPTTAEPTTAQPTTQVTEPINTGPVTETSEPIITEPTETKTTVAPVKALKKINTMKVTVKKKTVSAKKLKKGKVTVKALIIKKAKGKVIFKKLSGAKCLSLTAKGRIRIKKGTKKGTYRIKVKVKAKGNSSYTSKAITKTLKIRVK